MSPSRIRPRFGDVHRPYPPHAKIVATLGPASDSPDMIERLITLGVSVFRLNFSHGTLEDQLVRLQRVRGLSDRLGRPVAVLGDLQGPKMRVGPVPDVDQGGGIVINTGEEILFREGVDLAEVGPGHNDKDGYGAVFGVTFSNMFTDVEEGQRVLINDGAIRLLVIERDRGRQLRCRVMHGGRVTSGKGVNLPETNINVPAITERDWACVEWAISNRIDCLALSFVRTADEVLALKHRVAGICAIDPDRKGDPFCWDIPVISKIEKPEALANLEEIVEASDGVMVARGDLGVEMEAHHVPIAQKHIIASCADHGKPCIVATQMLETMITNPSPTRAEASDVANAIFDGADAVMLSGETAVGKHPDLVVETMARIIRAAEERIDQLPHDPVPPAKLVEYPFRSAAIATGSWYIAKRANAKLVVVWSQSGGMARYLSQHDFRIPILAFTSSDIAARRMALFGGVTPVPCAIPEQGLLSTWTNTVEQLILARGWAERGDSVVMIAGKPLGSRDAQDILSILRIGDASSGFLASDVQQ